MNATGANTRSAINSGWPSVALGYRYHVQLGKMLDEKRVTGNHLRPYLRNTDVQWDSVNVHDLPMMDFDAADRERYLLQKGDLLVCEGGEIGRAAIWSGELSECYYQKALHRLRPLDLASEHPRFMYYALLAAVGSDAYVNGGKSTIAHLPADQFRRIRLPRPPYREQERIASFLDQKTARIDALIAEKTVLCRHLADAREALAFALITRGLSQKTHRTGRKEPWLVSVPSNWALPKLGYFAEVGNGSTPKRDVERYWANDGVPWLTSGAVNAAVITGAAEYITPLALQECHLPMVRPGSTVVGLIGQGPTRGLAAGLVIPATLSQNVAYVSARDTVLDEYVTLALTGLYSAMRYLSDGVGGAQGAMNCEQLRNLRIPLPPNQDEQRALVERFRKGALAIAELLGHATNHIELLREYRQSLISAALGGPASHYLP